MDSSVATFQILADIRQLGCNNESLCAAAYRLYLYLCEERYLWDVQYHYSKQLDVIYLTARRHKDYPKTDVYIPVPSFSALSMIDIERYQAELAIPGTDNHRCIVLAFCDPSSSVLLYRMTDTMMSLADKPMSKNKLIKQKEEAQCSSKPD
ncbi:uncharacterized protein LOC131438305 [Malaya genurostris]|uniref:uncharacterized protein LOC131438305 n=1 Tax=Malaya genurostris TaxID=325434 RepID=UPI0026F3BF74|nr:uncharacterized protein LOC131438305 [Malaya genurostris]